MNAHRETTRTVNARARKASQDRLNAIGAGLQAEVYALNEAIRGGVEVRFPVRADSLASGLRVKSASYGHDGLWVQTVAYGGSYCLANDARWSGLLEIAGVARDPRAA